MKGPSLKLISLAIALLSLLPASAEAQNRSASRQATRAEISAIESYADEIARFAKRNSSKARNFANTATGNVDHWREFRSEKEREAADTGYNLNENALVWLRNGKVVGANFTFQSGSRDWAHFVMYYFREDGSLAKVEATLNTFYGEMSVFRERWYDREGKLLRSTAQYRDLRSRKRKKPGSASEFIDEPIPLYRSVKDLPFRHLLRRVPSDKGMRRHV